MTVLPRPPHNTAESKAATNQGGNGSKLRLFPFKIGLSGPTIFASNYTALGRFNAHFLLTFAIQGGHDRWAVYHGEGAGGWFD